MIEEEIVPAPIQPRGPCRQCSQHQHQQQLCLEDVINANKCRSSKCYSSDCVGPPPYGRSPVEITKESSNQAISIDEEEVAALLLEKNFAKRLLQARYPGLLASRSLNSSRKTLCCSREDPLARSLNASKKHLLLPNSPVFCCSENHLDSRSHASSRERLNSVRSKDSLRRSRLAQRKEDLQEILVHKLQNEAEDKNKQQQQQQQTEMTATTGRNRRSYETAQKHKLNGRSKGCSEGSYETNSSSESEQHQLLSKPANYTSV